MKYRRTLRFKREYQKFPSAVQKAFEKQIRFLMEDVRHPSLHAKKYDETNGIWQARVNKHVRFYFWIEGDVYWLLSMRKHRD